jgi:hypothetical protein
MGPDRAREVVRLIQPSRSAASTACVRSRASSFRKMLETWFFTVPSELDSSRAISAFDAPAATRWRISRSRGVRGLSFLEAMGSEARRARARVGAPGSTKTPPRATVRIASSSTESGAVLRTTPRQPASRASSATASSSIEVTRSARIGCPLRARARMTSAPERLGML